MATLIKAYTSVFYTDIGCFIITCNSFGYVRYFGSFLLTCNHKSRATHASQLTQAGTSK